MGNLIEFELYRFKVLLCLPSNVNMIYESRFVVVSGGCFL